VDRRPVGKYPSLLRYKGYGGITTEVAESLGLPKIYPPLEPLPNNVSAKLGYPEGAVTLGAYVQAYGHTGYYAEVIVPIVD
jgi:hypothetical protein